MIDKIILNIQHSDEYTDYLLMTAGLTNKRIIPMVNPSSEKLRAAQDNHTRVLRCYICREPMDGWRSSVYSDCNAGSIRVNSRYYLEDDGSINLNNAEIVRLTIEEIAKQVLMSDENLDEAYRIYFPILWGARQKIYADAKLFFVNSGVFGEPFYQNGMPVGAILKAMEEDDRTFRIRLGGGCSCGERPLLIDYAYIYNRYWTLYTWCPVCGSRREIRAWNFQRSFRFEKAINDAQSFYGKGVTRKSPLSLFDLVDQLRSA